MSDHNQPKGFNPANKTTTPESEHEANSDQTSTPETPEVTQNYVEKGKVVDDDKKSIADRYDNSGAARPTYSYGGIAGALEALSKYSGKDAEEDAPFGLDTSVTPKLIGVSRVSDKLADWHQHVSYQGKNIGPRLPALRSTGGNVTGRSAVDLYRRKTERGGELTYALPHTGITITVKPVPESAFIDAEYSITHQATRIGTSTTGMLLNPRSGAFSEVLINLALDHIVDANIERGDTSLRNALLDCIDPLDYGPLIWGVLATKYTNGHPWIMRCFNTDAGCEYQRDTTLNIGRMLWYDKSRLDEEQLRVLSNAGKRLTTEDIQKYRDSLPTADSQIYTDNYGVKYVFGSTNLSDFINSSKRWISEIEEAYNKSITSYTTPNEREGYLTRQISTRRTLKYLHFVSKVIIPVDEGDEIEVSEREDIRDILLELGNDHIQAIEFEYAVQAYINDVTIGIVGYPTYICPDCGHDPADYEDGDRFRTIVPIAADRLLFTLAQQRNMVTHEMGNV